MKTLFRNQMTAPRGGYSGTCRQKPRTSWFLKPTAFLAAFLLFAACTAMADTLNFVDWNTVTGSFVYDATTNSVVSFDFTSTAGGGTSFVGNGGIIVNNQDGDQVFSFDSLQPAFGRTDELDIVLACGGVLNCAEQATTGNSFAIAAGNPTCPSNPSAAAGFCIASGQQFGVPETLSSDLLSGGNFITITDPPSTDKVFTFTLSRTSTGTVFSGGGGSVPEPGTLSLIVPGLVALVGLKLRSKMTARAF